ncbi:MAG TPA: hypothetical protein PKM21_18975 [Anaerolineales bacterium]|nr:hypothetical protein [Anaerolineales bacterium]
MKPHQTLFVLLVTLALTACTQPTVAPSATLLPPTRTPAPTATPSPVPPTATASPSATISFTSTPEPLVVHCLEIGSEMPFEDAANLGLHI